MCSRRSFTLPRQQTVLTTEILGFEYRLLANESTELHGPGLRPNGKARAVLGNRESRMHHAYHYPYVSIFLKTRIHKRTHTHPKEYTNATILL